MKKSTVIMECIVILVSLLLIFQCLTVYNRERKELKETLAAGEVSRSTWQSISDEKETLQAELSQLKNDLKEAKLTISEKEAKKETLTADVEALRLELAELKGENR